MGIGGLRYMGIKLAHGLSAHVVAITTSAAKREDAIELGADAVVVSRNANEIAETQEMLDFCAENDITSDVEMIRMQEIENAYERMLKGDVKYRFVIDMSSLKRPG